MRLLIVNSSRSWCGVDQACRTASASGWEAESVLDLQEHAYRDPF